MFADRSTFGSPAHGVLCPGCCAGRTAPPGSGPDRTGDACPASSPSPARRAAPLPACRRGCRTAPRTAGGRRRRRDCRSRMARSARCGARSRRHLAGHPAIREPMVGRPLRMRQRVRRPSPRLRDHQRRVTAPTAPACAHRPRRPHDLGPRADTAADPSRPRVPQRASTATPWTVSRGAMRSTVPLRSVST